MVVSAHLGDFTAGLSLAGVFGGGDILYVILCYWDLCVYTKICLNDMAPLAKFS